MQSLLFAAVSLLILLPILYFLPLGFTLKGKIFIVMASLLIGIFGLVSVAVMPVWQTGLILLVFISAIVYLSSKHNLDWLYVSEDDVDPFELEKVAEKALPVKEINEAYSYIASSEKIPRGNLFEESLPPIRKHDSAPIEIDFLDKLVTQSQKNLTMINRSTDLNDREDNKRLVKVDENPILSEIDEQQIAVNQKDVSETGLIEDIESIDLITFEDSKPKMEMLFQTSENLDDSAIEAIVGNPVDITEETEPMSIQADDSFYYLSEIEKMLDAENGLEELEIIEEPSRETINLALMEQTFKDDDEFELEELMFAKQDTLPIKEKQKEKDQTEDRHMIKQ
ncbi:hypothetical protein [Bacillus sp. T3]|uniref:hypothetical protein n=1 Tax=Bacillus sp. T3 TaxID=467262 RepID=UPI00298204D5|nr:hypothetical protein [Bacillus sp. T3]